MKALIFLFLFGISLTWSFDPEKALNYAKKNCQYSYPIYDKLDLTSGDYSGIFTSQALYEGGAVIMWCFEWKDENFWIPRARNLMNCLLKHQWKSSTRPPKSFRPGYPIFSKTYNQAMIFGSFNGTKVNIYGHIGNMGHCNVEFGDKDDFIYFYL